MRKSNKMDAKNVEPRVDRAFKIKKLLDHHKPMFDMVGGNPLFCPKMFYTPSGKSELYVSFFPSELSKGQDIYTEKVDRDFNSEDPTRTLYRLDYNMYWENEYEKTTSTPVRYLVPVSELKKVNAFIDPRNQKAEQPVRFKSADTEPEDLELDDCPLEDITIRDLAALISWQPVSNRKFLNDLIKSTPRK